MAVPILIDTDMACDDAVALALAIASPVLDVRAVVSVGGVVDAAQALENIRRLLDALDPTTMPLTGKGMDAPSPGGADRRDRFGEDGMGDWNHPARRSLESVDFREAYEHAIRSAGRSLNILTLGPLTNLAAMIAEAPDLIRSVERIHLSGGAVWAQGNAAPHAEFNFHRNPEAAKTVLSSGLPITVAPLDVGAFVCLDQSHVAHLAASQYAAGRISATMLDHLLNQEGEPARGKTIVPAAVATGGLIWPDLFLKTRMRLEVTTTGEQAGRSKPALGGDKNQHVDLLTAVNAVDFLENLLESLCHEAFTV
ncbi:MAG: nucleoside hydrolase [Phycisphaerae bacterium]